ncbi:MAG: hypothetical protein R3B89_20935 [Polyangiaceae bacterium]
MRAGFVLAGLLVACGSSSSGGGGFDGGAGSAGSSSAGAAGASGTSAAGQGGGAGVPGGQGGGGAGGAGGRGLNLGPDDLACETVGGAGNCVSCCSTVHAAWEAVAPVTRACICSAATSCSADCPSYCVGESDDVACYACIFPELRPDGACYASTRDACAGDLDCVRYVDCRANCIQVLGNTP